MKKIVYIVVFLSILPMAVSAQLLKGKLVGVDAKSVTIAYSPRYIAIETDYKQIPVKDGEFVFDADIPGDTHDVSVEVGEHNVFDVHLVKGMTQEMVIIKENQGIVAEFPDKNATICRLLNRMRTAYQVSRYFPREERKDKTDADYRLRLDQEYAAVKPLLKKVKDKQLRSYYTRLNDALYKEQLLELVSKQAKDAGKEATELSEFTELMKDVDINDDVYVRTNLAFSKLMTGTKEKMAFGGDMGPYCEEVMQQTNQYVTNPNFRREVVISIGYFYFIYGDHSGDYHAFYDKYAKFAGEENADVLVRYKEQIEAWDRTKSGVPAYDITLTDRNDQTLQLSSLLKGKFTYIDVWATWCGPCKQEIPHYAKLVEKFKDNDKVQFISISIDENVKAWKKMIEDDKPAWPQYIINGETSRKFMADWGIQGIPRFIMIDKNGNIFAADASRPSDEKTALTIEEQTK